MRRNLKIVSDYYYVIMPITIVIIYMLFFQIHYYLQHGSRFFIFISSYFLLLLFFTHINLKLIKIFLSSFLIIICSFLVTLITGYGQELQDRSLDFFLGIIPFLWIKHGGHFVFFVMILMEGIFFILSSLCKIIKNPSSNFH